MLDKVKLIIDTDGVADDIRALSIALTHPNVEVLAISTVHGCVDVHKATTNIIRVRRACNAEHVPVYKGAEHPLLNKRTDEVPFFGTDGLGDKQGNWPEVLPSDNCSHESEVAALALIRLTRLHPEATLVCLGPLTNVALAIKLDSKFASQPRKMVIMGGNYYGIGNVGSTTAEYNFHGDPEAAAIVLKEMDTNLTIIPWELYFMEGREHQKTVDFDAHWKNHDTDMARFIEDATGTARIYLATKGKQYAFCDEIAIAVAIDEERVMNNFNMLCVHVELTGRHTRGQIAVDWTDVQWKDEDERYLTNEGKHANRTNKPKKFVTSYNVTVVDKWMHNAVSGEKDITKW